jgi:hypothetical protein
MTMPKKALHLIALSVSLVKREVCAAKDLKRLNSVTNYL